MRTIADRFQRLLGSRRGRPDGPGGDSRREWSDTAASRHITEFFPRFLDGRSAAWGALRSTPQDDGTTLLSLRGVAHARRLPDGTVAIYSHTDDIILADLQRAGAQRTPPTPFTVAD